ncbi:MAG: hypothetical protein LWW93_05490 [Hyphomicrobiales bacterium]|nr:hypothetical protein [Hyphomicrobiales bacterium]
MTSARLLFALFGLVAFLVGLAPSVHADDGDRAGWSVGTDPRRRAFLHYTPSEGGPRLLTIACLRDADEFAIYAQGFPGLKSVAGPAELALLVADAEFRIAGRVETDGFGVLGFTGYRDLDAASLKALKKELLPVLEAPGPIVAAIEPFDPMQIPLEEELPRHGVAEPLKTFVKICFGK